MRCGDSSDVNSAGATHHHPQSAAIGRVVGALLDASQSLARWLHEQDWLNMNTRWRSGPMLFDDDAETLPDSSASLADAVEWLRAEGFMAGDQRHVATVTRDTDDA